MIDELFVFFCKAFMVVMAACALGTIASILMAIASAAF